MRDTDEIRAEVYYKICPILNVSTDATIEFAIDRLLENIDYEGPRYAKALKIIEERYNLHELVMQYHKGSDLDVEKCFQELNTEGLRDEDFKHFIKGYLEKYGYRIFEDYIEELTSNIIDNLIFDGDDDYRKFQRLYALLTSDKSGRFESRLKQEIYNALKDLKIPDGQINLKKVLNKKYFSEIVSENDSEEVQKSKLKKNFKEAYNTFDFVGESKSVAYEIVAISFGVYVNEEIEEIIDSVLNVFDIEYDDDCRYEAVINCVKEIGSENDLDDEHIPPSIRRYQESLEKDK